jgi:hypothetical protein
VAHICHVTDIPVSEISIEVRRSKEHRSHVRNIRNIPATDIIVEIIFELKGTTHISYSCCVPITNVSESPFLFVLKPETKSNLEIIICENLIQEAIDKDHQIQRNTSVSLKKPLSTRPFGAGILREKVRIL